MIEISFLPSDAEFARLKMLPIANDLAHRLVAREGKKGMEMIWHEQKQRDVPALFDLVKSSGIQQRLRERGVSQWASLFFAVNGDSDVKQRAGLDPVRDFMMQFGREPAVEHRVIVKRAFGRFKVDRPLRRTMLINAASPPFLTSRSPRRRPARSTQVARPRCEATARLHFARLPIHRVAIAGQAQ